VVLGLGKIVFIAFPCAKVLYWYLVAKGPGKMRMQLYRHLGVADGPQNDLLEASFNSMTGVSVSNPQQFF